MPDLYKESLTRILVIIKATVVYLWQDSKTLRRPAHAGQESMLWNSLPCSLLHMSYRLNSLQGVI